MSSEKKERELHIALFVILHNPRSWGIIVLQADLIFQQVLAHHELFR